MNAFEKMLICLQKTMEPPAPYGTFHVVSCLMTLCVTVALCFFLRDAKDRHFRAALLAFWIALVLFELYKQLVLSATPTEDGVRWRYLWRSFPFQFCDSPFYVLPIAALAKEGKVRDAALAFLATYALFAGLVVYVRPIDALFHEYIGINVQTMFHHGVQIALGVFIAVHERKRHWHFFHAASIFTLLAAIAIGFNLLAHRFLPEEGVNMYFLSPYRPCPLPLIGLASEKLGWWARVVTYLVGFTLAAFLIYAAEWALTKPCKRRKTKIETS